MARKVKEAWEKITKEQFNKACEKYPPNKWIIFAYKYFSKNTVKSDLALKNSIIFIFIALFSIGFLGTVFNASKKMIMMSTIIYSILLGVLVLYLFSAAFMNYFRLMKICEELGVSRKEYDKLVEKFSD